MATYTFTARQVPGGELVEVEQDAVAERISVYGLVIKADKILLLPSFDGYDYPGGGLDAGETLEEAFTREVFEETGFTVERGELLHVVDDFVILPDSEEAFHGVCFFYLGLNPQGEISTEGFDDFEKEYAKEAVWVPLEEAKGLKYINGVTDQVSLIESAIRAIKN